MFRLVMKDSPSAPAKKAFRCSRSEAQRKYRLTTDENQIHTDKEVASASWKLEFTCSMLCSLRPVSPKTLKNSRLAREIFCIPVS
jgi:hypothetical protein